MKEVSDPSRSRRQSAAVAIASRAAAASSLLLVAAVGSTCMSMLLPVANADKDTDYYRPNFVNPNVDQKMYWKDSVNVLQDLDQFHSLYVKYEGCVWSKWGSRYANYFDDDDERDDEEISTERGCGVGGGESHWYLGRTQCFRANAAFTLYGILKDDVYEEALSKSGKKCHKGTFINSFFTTFGVEAFAGPLGLGTDDANSYCQTYAPAEDDQMYYYDNMDVDDDEDHDNDEHNFKNYAAYTSYGTACENKKFVTHQYTGAFCDGHTGYVATTSVLENFNQAIESQDCVQIYSSNGNNNNNQEDGRELENNGDDDNAAKYEVDFTEVSPVNILMFSRACSIRQYPDNCPDPYGLLLKYDKALTRALKTTPTTWKSGAEKTMNAFSGIFLALGAVYLFFAFRVKRRMDRKGIKTADDDGAAGCFGRKGSSSNSENQSKDLAEPEPVQRPRSQLSVMAASVASSVGCGGGGNSTVASQQGEEQEWMDQQSVACSSVAGGGSVRQGSVAGGSVAGGSVAGSAVSSVKGGKDDGSAANPVLAWDGEVNDSTATATTNETSADTSSSEKNKSKSSFSLSPRKMFSKRK